MVQPLPADIAAATSATVDPLSAIKTAENEHNDSIVCDICLEADDWEGDEIVICELCFAASHQSCYGSEIFNRLPLPDQPWYCDRCLNHTMHNKPIDEMLCALCPDPKGIIKQLSFTTGSAAKIWAHPICVNWTPEIWFADELKTKIGGQLSKLRKQLRCGSCLKIKGSCIQCDFKDCKKSWHVRCAVKKGVIGEWEQMQAELGDPADDMLTPLFCKEHATSGKNAFKQ